MDLFQVQKGKKREPFNVILFGVPGIGKSSWAGGYVDREGVQHHGAPSPLFLGGEETRELDIERLPQAKSYTDFVSQVDHLISTAKDSSYKTIVVDTIDSVESLLHQKILAEDPKQTGSMIAAHGGYGKAYEIAAGQLLILRNKFKILRDQFGMNLIFLAHSKKAQAVDTILGLQYDTFELNLHQKAQAVFVDWVSAVLFANYIVHQQQGTNTERAFAFGEGERVLLTSKRPGHLAKNRFNLPYEMPLEFNVFNEAYSSFFDDGPNADGLSKSIAGLIENIEDPELKQKVSVQFISAGMDMKKLGKIEQRLKEIIQ